MKPPRPISMKPVRPISKVRNPQGRLDWLASQILARVAQKHPLTEAIHKELEPEIEALIGQYLGPHNREARKVTRAVRIGARILRKGVA